jgi:hypothetical protein
MYSTCLFCKTNLGANQAIEQFPIGRRLAFDAAKGRLWVVCRKCERWNLTPIEERWEAIEECERSYRSTKLRVATDEIGLARLSEGLELVRIGRPLRPEFAAWRYGDQFGRRRRRKFIQVGAAVVGAAAIPLAGPLLGISVGAAGWQLLQFAAQGTAMVQQRRIVARLATADGRLLMVRRRQVKETGMLPPDGRDPWGLTITHHTNTDAPWWKYGRETEEAVLRGDDAMRAAAQLLPHLNQNGASARVVRDAVTVATASDDPTAAFESAARFASKRVDWRDYGKGAMLNRIPPELRLALEMVSHEDSERRALEGELFLLEDAWREAEEIAAISDNLFLPTEISTRLDEMKRDGA